MRVVTVGTIVACATAVAAFKDTSPFFLFSTAELPSNTTVAQAQLQSRQQVLQSTKDFLSSCPTDSYIMIEQEGVNAQDFSGSRAASGLRKAMASGGIKHSVNIADVVDGVDFAELVSYLQETCSSTVPDLEDKTSGNDHTIYRRLFTAPSGTSAEERASALASNDANLFTSAEPLMGKSYTLIYTTLPSSSDISTIHTSAYEPEFQSPLHVEMKRASNVHKRNSNSTVPKNAPLFEKYQFFTPGLFMGIFVSLILLAILSVAITAVSSLTVSYGAFDKEMGPAAQRKAQ